MRSSRRVLHVVHFGAVIVAVVIVVVNVVAGSASTRNDNTSRETLLWWLWFTHTPDFIVSAYVCKALMLI